MRLLRCPPWLVILLLMFGLSGTVAADGGDAPVTLPKQEELLGLLVQGNSSFRHQLPAEVRAIEEAYRAGEYAKVEFLARLHIATPYKGHENPPYLARLKADALYHMYLLSLLSGKSEEEANPLFMGAARLGHKPMITEFLSEVAEDKPRVHDVRVRPEAYNLREIMFIAAELGDPLATSLVADAPEGKLRPEQRDYWQLQKLARKENRQERLDAVAGALKLMGPMRLSQALRTQSLVGDVTRPESRGLPGRGEMATVFVEMMMRDALGAAIGMEIEISGEPPAAPTILDGYRAMAGVVHEYGMADAYLLVPTGSEHRGPLLRSMRREDMMDSLLPGDCVYVTCGGLSHAAVVFKHDRQKRQLFFLDSNHQYWQPSHNRCITERSFRDFGLGRGLVVLDDAEVLPILQAVKTIRDRQEATAAHHQRIGRALVPRRDAGVTGKQ